MQVQVKDTTGQVVETAEISDLLFKAPVHQAVVHQALVRERAGQRKGTANTKTRAEVSGGGRKPWSQKGTGRARHGSTRSPIWRKGGVVFGPHPRSYAQKLPKKMRRLALRSLLSAKAADGQLVVLKDFSLDRPRTKEVLHVLDNLEVKNSALIVTKELDRTLAKAIDNLKQVGVRPTLHLTLADLLNHDTLIMTIDAVRKAEAVWATPIDRKKNRLVEAPQA